MWLLLTAVGLSAEMLFIVVLGRRVTGRYDAEQSKAAATTDAGQPHGPALCACATPGACAALRVYAERRSTPARSAQAGGAVV